MVKEQSASMLAKAPRAVVIRTLKQWIEEGSLVRGMPIPSERELAEKLSVSRETIRRALLVLEKDGIIASRGPRTRLVTNPPAKAKESGLLRDAIAVIHHGPWHVDPSHRDTGWSDSLIQGAMDTIAESGMHGVMFQSQRLVRGNTESLFVGRPSGVLVPSEIIGREVDLLQLLHRLKDSGIPVITSSDAPEVQNFDRVTSDHKAGAYELTKWLIAQGAKRILQLCGDKKVLYWMEGRRAGYEQAMTEAGLALLPLLALPKGHPNDGNPRDPEFPARVRLVGGYFIEYLTGPEPIDAIMCASDGEICTMAGVCRLYGKIPNKDVLLAGYDDYWDESWSQIQSIKPLATVNKLNYQMGMEMVRLLEQRVHGELTAQPECRVLLPKLIAPVPDQPPVR